MKRREATIWNDGFRCAISERFTYSKFVVAHWIGYDGEKYSSWTQDQDFAGVGIDHSGTNITAPGKVHGHICSDLTIHRVLGQYLHCRDVALFEIFDHVPKSLAVEAIDGNECLKVTFESVILPPSMPGVTYTVIVWLDRAIGTIPRRLRVEASNGEFTETRILETQQVAAEDGTKWNLPAIARVTTDHYTIELHYSEIAAVSSIPDDKFVPPMPFGTQVFDESNGEQVVSYIGGAEGQREWMRLAGVDQTVIKAVIDNDPSAIQAVQAAVPAANQQPLAKTLQAPINDSRNSTWSIALIVLACVLGVVAFACKFKFPQR